jgi:hypothetical protein
MAGIVLKPGGITERVNLQLEILGNTRLLGEVGEELREG